MKRIAATTLFIFLLGLVGCQSTSLAWGPFPTGPPPSAQVLSERQALLIAWNPFSEQEILPLWEAVAAHVTYKKDYKENEPIADLCQNPRETYDIRTGDCEDINLLLASALLAEGHDVCVVVGTTNPAGDYINHAWILLTLNGKSYYLDGTVDVPKSLDMYEVGRWPWLIRYIVRPH
jgi:hypothetical protein